MHFIDHLTELSTAIEEQIDILVQTEIRKFRKSKAFKQHIKDKSFQSYDRLLQSHEDIHSRLIKMSVKVDELTYKNAMLLETLLGVGVNSGN